MTKLLLNANGKALMSESGKVYKAPEVDTSIEDGLLTDTLESYSNDRITVLSTYSLYKKLN